VLGDGDRHERSLSVLGNSLHLEALEELHVVHESLEGLGPSISNSLDEFTLHLVNLKLGVSRSSFELFCVFDDKGLNNNLLSNSLENVLLDHVVNEQLDTLVNRVSTSVDGEDMLSLGLIVRSGDTGEVRNGTSTSLFVEALGVSLFASLEGSVNVSLSVLEVSLLVSGEDIFSGTSLGGDERAEDDLSSLVEKLGDFSDTTDVLSTVFGRESKTLVHSLSNDITIEA
jgi:hypothetical protein